MNPPLESWIGTGVLGLAVLVAAGCADRLGDTSMRVAVQVEGNEYHLDYHRLCAINTENFTARATQRSGYSGSGTHLVVNGYRNADRHVGSVDFSIDGRHYDSLGPIKVDRDQRTISWSGDFQVMDRSRDQDIGLRTASGAIRVEC